ncbi:MAG: hypothetical protein KatS3mg113_0154 [Planctomycetaceae bacterium]|nr:MAG: hypothetical protein KatS3mg113_0154 [Planctomycetaceae bacterium]
MAKKKATTTSASRRNAPSSRRATSSSKTAATRASSSKKKTAQPIKTKSVTRVTRTKATAAKKTKTVSRPAPQNADRPRTKLERTPKLKDPRKPRRENGAPVSQASESSAVEQAVMVSSHTPSYLDAIPRHPEQPPLEPPLSPQEITEFHEMLVELRHRVRGDVEAMTREALERHPEGSEPRSPTHLAELGSDTFDQELALMRVESEHGILQEIDDALERIREGIYGFCEACLDAGVPRDRAVIPRERLKILPYARNCVACERKREQRRRW